MMHLNNYNEGCSCINQLECYPVSYGTQLDFYGIGYNCISIKMDNREKVFFSVDTQRVGTIIILKRTIKVFLLIGSCFLNMFYIVLSSYLVCVGSPSISRWDIVWWRVQLRKHFPIFLFLFFLFWCHSKNLEYILLFFFYYNVKSHTIFVRFEGTQETTYAAKSFFFFISISLK